MRRKYGLAMVLIIIFTMMSGCINTAPANSWALKLTQIEKLHALGLNGDGVIIGIIDTGVETGHGDFDSFAFIAWQDYINNLSYPYDDEGHGTHIAGILFARESWMGILSGHKLEGICPDADAIIVKVISKTGECSDENLADAIDFCIDHGADIILLSLSSNPENLEIGERTYMSCERAIEQGVFVVVPAGDDGENDDGDVDILANVSEAISVGSVRRDGYTSSFSSRGNQAYLPGKHDERNDPNKKPELVAPGEGIVSTYLDGGYISMSGTSQSATYVAGIIALLLEAYPQLEKNKERVIIIKEVLAKTAKKIGGNALYTGEPFSHNDRYGYGLVQAYDAYVELSNYVEG